MEPIVELVVRALGRRPRNGPISTSPGDVGILVGVGAVTVLLPISEGAAQLGVLSEEVVIEDAGFLALVARSTTTTRTRNALAVTKFGHRITALLTNANFEFVRKEIVIIRVALDDESTSLTKAFGNARLHNCQHSQRDRKGVTHTLIVTRAAVAATSVGWRSTTGSTRSGLIGRTIKDVGHD
jgi:hypothetical protein